VYKECINIEERQKRRSQKLNDFKETKERRWEEELGLQKKTKKKTIASAKLDIR
jgi:hypothetical protein